jgi:CheY-like chemotaxis protein
MSTLLPRHILLVDDEDVIRTLLSEFLGRHGYRITAAASADEALRAIQRTVPDLAVCDLQMDDRDGLVLIDQLRQTHPSLPIMILTGIIFDPEVVRETLLNRASSCLCKTASLQEILAEVRRLLGET